MIGVIMFLNSRGDIVLSRALRDGFSIRILAETFRSDVITGKRTERSPINIIDKVAYMHMRHENVYLVCCANNNVNCIMVFQYMSRLLQVFNSYFHSVNEYVLKQNFVACQEIIDETLDYGYPQQMEIDVLKSYITASGIKGDVLKKAAESEKITVKATGRIPWRKEGIRHPVNECYLDVIEVVNMLMSQNGNTLQLEVTGRIVLKSKLSGMPECNLILNDKMMLNRQDGASENEKIELDDVTFHSCVRLSNFDTDRSITFVPPDDECVLMRYRSSSNVDPPFRILNSRVKEVSKTRMELFFRVKACFPARKHARDVIIKTPCPSSTANVKIQVGQGKAKYDPTSHAIVWKIKRMQGETEVAFAAEISLIASTVQGNEKGWSKPPISIGFELDSFACSGLEIMHLKVTEPHMKYKAKAGARYVSVGGQYQCRL